MKKQNFFIYPLFLISVFLVLMSSCKICKKNDSKPLPIEDGQMTDSRDGTVYKTVTIGNQVWMAENLKYLPSVSGPQTGSQTEPHYYVYAYNGTNVAEAKATSNYKTYGVLYNWSAAMARSKSSKANPSRIQGVCPKGWHVPSDAEWNQLTDYLGGLNTAGGKLKHNGTTNWSSPNTGATNESAFTALPSGLRTSSGIFNYIGKYGYWWSTTEGSANNVLDRSMRYDLGNVSSSNVGKEPGYSVRCLKD